MEKFYLILILMTARLHLTCSQTESLALTELQQTNPSFQTFLKDNPRILNLLQTNPELVSQFQQNPNLINQTMDHAQFMNSFLEENAHLNQIIKDNPSVYGFILKQVDHAVGTGQNSTIVIEMTEADRNEANKELQEAQKNKQTQMSKEQEAKKANTGGQTQTASAQDISNGISGESSRQSDALAGLSKEQMLTLLTHYQQIIDTHNLKNPNQSPGHSTSISSQTPSMNSSSSGNNSGSSSFKQEDLLNMDNVEDLIKLGTLYTAMYNRQPTSLQDLQHFYSVILPQLNIRTRKQVSNFLARFKSDGSQTATTANNAFGYSNGATGYSNNNNVYSNDVYGRPSRMSACKKRRFCRWNPNSVICRPDPPPPPPPAPATSWFKKLGF